MKGNQNLLKIVTVLNEISTGELGLTLPHEHLFTDLRGPTVDDYAQADPIRVLSVMKPYIADVKKFGVRSIVECSTIGVGRNPKILKTIAIHTGINIIAPTGVYREWYVPDEIRNLTVEALADRWIKDLTIGIDGSDVKAGFIKMAVSDEEITLLEQKNLQAAVIASRHTGAVIACHTIGGKLVEQLIDLLDEYGHNLERFIWTHAQSEPDIDYQFRAAERGVYISIDAIGSGWTPDEDMLEKTIALINAGYSNKILLSHDAGWYDPSQPDGKPADQGIRGYTDLFKTFIPSLQSRGVDQETIDEITVNNPAIAFSLLDKDKEI